MSDSNPLISAVGPANRRDLVRDLVLPTILFAALGAMSWAIRGCSGFGGSSGCIFAGVLWGAAWWYIARDPSATQSRRYSSGWIVLAMTIGVGISGARGWIQWSTFFEGRLQLNTPAQEFAPIPRVYGFVWLFIAGMPWAGIGACMLAWCGSLRKMSLGHWLLRIGCGIGGILIARWVFSDFPQYVLPLYDALEAKYQDLDTYPNLHRLVNDCRNAVTHLGCYLGLLLFEVARRDWKNVVLISTVGVVAGSGWALCQNWMWADEVWPGASFNWWRAWETSGGISIGIAYGLAYFLVNRPMGPRESAVLSSERSIAGPSFEWLLVYLTLVSLTAMVVRYSFRQWGSAVFSLIIFLGLMYYVMNRGVAVDDVPPRSMRERLANLRKNIEWAAVAMGVLLVGALIGGDVIFHLHGMRGLRSYAMLYVIVVGLTLTFGWIYYFVRRRMFDDEKERVTPSGGDPNIERLGLYLGLLMGVGLSLRNGLKGCFGIYDQDRRDEWGEILWYGFGPLFLFCLLLIAFTVLLRPLPRSFRGNVFPYAYGLLWIVLITHNVIAQLVTGPPWHWAEMAFNIYYALLFVITALVVFHIRSTKRPIGTD